MTSKPNVRLSKNIIPTRYSLQIKPDIEASTFVGSEVIDISLTKNIKEITLHSKELEITDGWWQIGKTKIDISSTSYNEKSETATFSFSKSLPKGKGKLHLHFRGIISQKLRGFYSSKYEYKGKTMKIATTQFEATDARRAFPCFDEPSQKAVFEVTLIVPKHLTTISNTFELQGHNPTPKGVEHSPGYKVVKYAPTPKMSTYLLAYVIGEFDSVQTKTKDGVVIRVFTTPGKKDQAQFSLDVAKRTLEFLNDYFKIPYPLPGLDLIAVPDFSAGAMENWGAVTFRETALLFDEKNTSFANKQNIAYTIAHELVHQWFGNLVTMEWWTHLWLNESFATFMGYIAIDDLFPQWHIWTKFVMYDHASALELDCLENTHPIEVEVHHPDQISEIFDAISYEKGGSVLRMLMYYIGPQNFRKGLTYYLKKHSYKNTESIHLWEAFEKVSGKPVSKFMSKWVGKSGYPMITVFENKPGKLTFSQNRFTLLKNTDKTTWPIPIQFELGKGKVSEMELFTKRNHSTSVSFDAQYMKANPMETGFFRTLYSPSLLAKLYEPIKNKELSVEDRFGIIRDLLAMVKAGLIPTSAYLEYIQAYLDEDSYIVWTEILSGMNEIYNLLGDSPELQNKLAKYYLGILKLASNKVGWIPQHKETQTRVLLRSIILANYGSYGDKSTIKTAQKVFASRKSKAIKPDLRATVYFLNASSGNETTLKQLQKMYLNETLQEEQRRVSRALISFRNKKLFKKSLDFILTPQVRTQDAPLLIAASFNNLHNRDLSWAWLQKNWKTIHERYHDDHLLARIIGQMNGFTSKAKLLEIKNFFKTHPVPSAERTIKQTLEQIQIRSNWYKRDKSDLNQFLKRLHK